MTRRSIWAGTVALGLAAAAMAPAARAIPSPWAAQAVCGPVWQVTKGAKVPTGVLFGVSVASAKETWAVGTYETRIPGPDVTLVERWDGTNWAIVPSPNPIVGPNEFLSVSAVLPGDAWGVGFYGDVDNFASTPLAEHWNGTKWSIVSTPTPKKSSSRLESVAAVASDDVWAVGTATTSLADETLVEHWNGSSWSIIPSPNAPGSVTSELHSIAVASEADIWAVGERVRKGLTSPLIEHWDGSSWSIVPGSPGEPSGSSLRAVSAVSVDDAWAVGLGPTDTSLIEHWDGSAWSVVPGIGGGLYAIAGNLSKDVWAAGEPAIQSAVPIIHWEGSTWNLSTGAKDPMLGLAVTETGKAWAVGRGTGSPTPPVIQRVCPILVTDEGVSPPDSSVKFGTPYWRFPASNNQPHRIVDSSGMGLFDSGLEPPGSTFSFDFVAAGTFPFADPTTGSSGSIGVGMSFRHRAHVSERVRITWAVGRPPGDFVYDIQVKTPGASGFSDWLSGEARFYANYDPIQPGTYEFRARVRDLDNGYFSGWSPEGSLIVT